jgi:hypothetical protein
MAQGGMGYEEMAPDGFPRSSLPWQERERHGSAFAALLKTIRVVLLEPSDAFSHIRVDGSLGGSMLYVVLLGTVGGVAGVLWQLLMRTNMPMASLPIPMAPNEQQFITEYMGMMQRMVQGFMVFWIVMMPFTVLIASMVNALIVHCCLWLVGGAREPFEATYAVIAYASGSTALLKVVPVCGALAAVIWSLVIDIIGLARVHNCGTGRAVLAVLLPLIACCGCCVLLFAALIGLAAAGAHP